MKRASRLNRLVTRSLTSTQRLATWGWQTYSLVIRTDVGGPIADNPMYALLFLARGLYEWVQHITTLTEFGGPPITVVSPLDYIPFPRSGPLILRSTDARVFEADSVQTVPLGGTVSW